MKKGITLVTLVVTIMVLIILAGIVISILYNNNIIEKTKKASFANELSSVTDAVKLNKISFSNASLSYFGKQEKIEFEEEVEVSDSTLPDSLKIEIAKVRHLGVTYKNDDALISEFESYDDENLWYVDSQITGDPTPKQYIYDTSNGTIFKVKQTKIEGNIYHSYMWYTLSSNLPDDILNPEDIVNAINDSDWEVNESGYITKYKGNQSNVIIPNVINGERVLGIGDGINSIFGTESPSVTQITISKGIVSINANAFSSSKTQNTNAITLNEGLMQIGANAFTGISGIHKVVIPSTVSVVGDNIFSGCNNLNELTLSKAALDKGIYGLTATKSTIQTVTLHNGISDIPTHSFVNQTKLQNITMPDTITSINTSAFEGCTGLQSIILSEELITIGDSSFNGSYLIHLTIPSKVLTIGNKAFYNCSQLQTVTIQGGVTSIGENAFYGCINLSKIIIPDTITNCGNGIFSGCNNLREITVNQVVLNKGMNNLFNSSNSLVTVNFTENVTSIPDNCFASQNKLNTVNLTNNITSIGSKAFSSNNELRNISIPTSVQTIASDAFYNSLNLVNISLNGNTISGSPWGATNAHIN